MHAVFTPAGHVEQAAQGSWPDADQAKPASHLHTVFAFGLHVFHTPAAPHFLHLLHGGLPDLDQVEPASHGVLHTVFAVSVHSVFTPAAHVEGAAQAAQGALPEADQVEPAWHLL